MTSPARPRSDLLRPGFWRRFDLAPLLVIAVLILLWQLGVSGSDFVSDTLAPPGAVLIALLKLIIAGDVLRASLDTLVAALLGMALGVALGSLIGLLSGLLPPVAAAIHGPVEILRPLPAIALVPFATIALGLGLKMEVSVIAFAVIWPAIILTAQAVGQIEPQLLDVADALELGRTARAWKIVLPAILPRLVVMLRFAAGIALLIAVTVELVSNPRGLGHAMMLAAEAYTPAPMLAYLIVIAAIGWGLNAALLAGERRILGGMRP